MSTLQCIDISAFLSSDSTQEEKQQIAQQIYSSCTNDGFLYLDNTNQQLISHALVSSTRRLLVDFFNLPQEQKMRLHMSQTNTTRGYFYAGQSNQNESKGIMDAKEGFYWSKEENLFPSQQEEFSTTLLQYYDKMECIGRGLLHAFAHSFHLQENYFDSLFFPNPTALLRALHYFPISNYSNLFPKEEEEQIISCASHTDYGMVTILLQDDHVSGLEAQIKEEEWTPVKSFPNTFVVNLGDCLQRWTNNQFRATRHRVVPVKQDRYSIPFFFEPRMDAIIHPLPCFVDETSYFEPVQYSEYLNRIFATKQ